MLEKPSPLPARSAGSGKQLGADLRPLLDADEALLEPLVEVAEGVRVEAEQVQDGGLKVVDAQLEFAADGSSVVLHQNGRSTRATRR